MNAKIAALAGRVALAPDDPAVRAVYADALLEADTPGLRTMGELVVVSNAIAAGDASEELAQKRRRLERSVRQAVATAVGSEAFALCTFRHGLVGRVELGPKPMSLEDLEALLRLPELATVTAFDLRRAWPTRSSNRSWWRKGKPTPGPAELLEALPSLLGARTRWLGIGAGAAGVGATEIAALFGAFANLSGLGIVADDAIAALEVLAKERRLVDLEFAAADFDANALEELLASGMKLERLVLFAADDVPDARALGPIFTKRAFPKLTSFGLMAPAYDVDARMLPTLVKSPLFAQLTSFGVALDDAEDLSTWLGDNGKRIADKALFTGPSSILDGAEWDDAQDELARVFDALDRNAEALAIREQLVFANPASGWFWDNLGDSLSANGHPTDALEAHDKALALEPTMETPWAGRGDALHDLERYEEAVVAWDKVLALDPNDARAHHVRAMCLEALGRDEEALQGFSQAWKLDKELGDAVARRGDLYLKLGRLDLALRDFQTAVKQDDEAVVYDAHVGMAFVARVRGDFDSAKRHFERARASASTPDAVAAIAPCLGRIAVARGRLDEARRIFAQICASAAADDDDRDEFAWISLELGDVAEARASWSAIEDGPSVQDRAFLATASGADAEALAILEADRAAPMEGCLYHDLGNLLLLGVLLRRAGREAEATALLRSARPAPRDPKELQRVLTERAVASGGKPACDNPWCLGATAAAAIVACVLDDADEEAAARSQALGVALTTQDPSDRYDRAWALRRIVRMADVSAPLLERVFQVVEGVALPESLLTKPKRPSRTK